MAPISSRLVGGAAVAIAAAAAWEAVRRHDARAIEQDPERSSLWRPVEGEPVTVTSADGTELHAELFGPASAPPIVLIHGWTCNLRFWVNQIHDLAGRHRVIAFDLRGHGRSGVPRDGAFSTQALAADLQAVLEATVPDGQRAVLVGHSLGAMTIVAWAGERPEEVERRAAGAALLNTGLGDLLSESLVVRVPSRLGRLKGVLGRAFLTAPGPLPPPSPISTRFFRHAILCRSASPAQVAFCQEIVRACRPDARVGCGRMLSELDLLDAVHRLTVPTSVVAGSLDRLTPPSHAERMARALPDLVERVVVDACGHMGPVEAPDAILGVIERLVARVRVPEPALAA